MGIRLFSDGPGSLVVRDETPLNTNPQPRKDGNPSPYRWELVREELIGSWVVVTMRYLDCFNFEGKKILVYDNVDKYRELIASGVVDPHFLDNNYSPIARFEPTNKGWALAIQFARQMQRTVH